MSEDIDKEEISIYYKNKTLPRKALENVAIFVSIVQTITFSLVAIVMIYFLALGGLLPRVLGFLLCGGLILIGIVLGSIAVIKAIAKSKTKTTFKDHINLENRIIKGDSLSLAEMHQLVDDYTKMKCLLAAEMYSHSLLKLSNDEKDSVEKTPGWTVCTPCDASTGKYLKSLYYFVACYQFMPKSETSGILTLSPDNLSFEGEIFSFSCHPSKIKSIELKRLAWWAFSAPSYIKITIGDSNMEDVFCLIPRCGDVFVFDPTSQNEITNIWLERIQNAHQAKHS